MLWRSHACVPAIHSPQPGFHGMIQFDQLQQFHALPECTSRLALRTASSSAETSPADRVNVERARA